MSPLRPNDPNKNRPAPEEEPEEDNSYNDIEWDDEDHVDGEWEDEKELFRDGRLRGAVGLTDWISKKMLVVGGCIVLSLILLFSVLTWYKSQFDTSGPQGAEVTVEVPEGMTLNKFSGTLAKDGIVPTALGLRIYVKFHDAPPLQAGEYVFHKNSTPEQAIDDIKKGPKQATDRLVVPEGFRLKQIAERVGRIPGFSSQKFLDIANSGTIRSAYQSADSKSLEGFLFPDTYLLSSRDTETTLLERMRNEFDSTVKAMGIDRSDRAIGHSPFETVIIASLIEAEAKTDVDRGKISQVIENRLNQKMPLQIDATVLYALGNTKNTLTDKDKKFPNGYNTYWGVGLPDGPICMPGKKSIQAALAPTPGPWLYYVVSDAQGNHTFSVTREEHDKAAAEARAKGLF